MRNAVIGTVLAGAFLFALSLFFGGYYTVDEGERGVLLTNGRLSEVVQPGFGPKVPFVQKVAKISVRQGVQRWSYEGQNADYRMEAYSRDQQPADLTVSVNYHIDPAKVAEVYQRYQTEDNLVSRTVNRETPVAIKEVFGQYDSVSVIAKRAEFNAAVSERVTKQLAGELLVVDGVQIEDISFSPAYEKAVEDRMTAQVAVERQKQEALKEKVQAEIVVIKANAEADSVRAAADAKAHATKVQGEAEAEAIKARAAALGSNPALVELTKAEKWDGKLPTTVLPNGTVPFIEAGAKP